MTDYIIISVLIERIKSAEKTIPKWMNPIMQDGCFWGLERAIKEAEAIPAADVREVVYCKDCRHRDPEDHKCDCGGTERQGCPFKVADDYFCAYGER